MTLLSFDYISVSSTGARIAVVAFCFMALLITNTCELPFPAAMQCTKSYNWWGRRPLPTYARGYLTVCHANLGASLGAEVVILLLLPTLLLLLPPQTLHSSPRM